MTAPSPASIVIVDNDEPFARSVQILLEDEGRHHVAVAPSADHALRALSAGTKIDLLIVDLAILDKAGSRLGREIQDRQDNFAIIVMTAHAAAMDAARPRWVNAAGFLTKPLDPGTLLAMVSSALPGKRFRVAGSACRIPSAAVPGRSASPRPSSRNRHGGSE